MGNSICHSNAIYKSMLELGLPGHFRRVVLTHIMAILISVFVRGYRGKTVQVSASSPRHRTAVAHFLNAGKWDDAELERLYKEAVIRRIWAESEKSGQPIGCIADDTIASKTKPSSQASRPIEAADFHYSHLKRKQDYGHQVVEILLTCNGLTLSYASVLYDKARSKIAITREIAEELPVPPGKGYFLCDCWYSCKELLDAFAAKGFQTVCALKSNRVIYPYDVKQSVSQFAATLCAEYPEAADLVTVGGRTYYAYLAKVRLNGLGARAVVFCFPENAFGDLSALRVFLSTDTSLSMREILNLYALRWRVEVFFRRVKQKLAFDKCQIRSVVGIRRFWLLMSVAHFFCCTQENACFSFEKGYAYFSQQIQIERITYIYQSGVNHEPLENLLTFIA